MDVLFILLDEVLIRNNGGWIELFNRFCVQDFFQQEYMFVDNFGWLLAHTQIVGEDLFLFDANEIGLE